MDSSYAIIRRFTPPTCTLEILGKKSLLSRWSNKIVLKDARFKLSFDDPKILEAEPIVIKGDRKELDTLYNSVLDYSGRFLSQSFATNYQGTTTSRLQEEKSSQLISLTPKSLVSHQLSWLSLSGGSPIKPIQLSATQLFDLVTALEDYKSEMLMLTQLETQQKSPSIIPIGWSVAGLVLVVGLTSIGLKVASNQQVNDSIARNSTETSITPEIATPEVIAPQLPTSNNSAPNLQEDEALSSSEILPPPPSVNTPKPPPDIPDPALYPPSGSLQIPPLASFPDLNQPSVDGQAIDSVQNNNAQVESKITVPPQPPVKSPVESPIQSKTQTRVARSQTDIPVNTNPQGSPPESSSNFSSDRQQEINIAASNLENKPSSRSTIDPSSKIPQLVQQLEIEAYLQQKWQPPSELRQTLEYRLFLAQDGSLTKIIALGKTSANYLDRTGLPNQGQSFVAPLNNRDSATVRLLLSPDGEVRTFLE